MLSTIPNGHFCNISLTLLICYAYIVIATGSDLIVEYELNAKLNDDVSLRMWVSVSQEIPAYFVTGLPQSGKSQEKLFRVRNVLGEFWKKILKSQEKVRQIGSENCMGI